MKKILPTLLCALAALAYAAPGVADDKAGANVGVGAGANVNLGAPPASGGASVNVGGQAGAEQQSGADRGQTRMSSEGQVNEKSTVTPTKRRTMKYPPQPQAGTSSSSSTGAGATTR